MRRVFPILLALAATTSSLFPPPDLNFVSPTATFATSHTSCVRFQLSVASIPYPFMHLLELSIFNHSTTALEVESSTSPSSPTPLGVISKLIAPGTDLHSSSKRRKKRQQMAQQALEEYPNLAQYANQQMEDGDLYVSDPEILDFIARGLPNGKYRATCTLKRRNIQSDVGVTLPPFVPASVDLIFQVEAYAIAVQITHLNHVTINNNNPTEPQTYFSTIPSVLLNFTAMFDQQQLPFRIPADGSLSIKVNGQPHRGPLLSYPDGASLLVGGLDDGAHVIELSPVDSLDGEPIPEASHVVAALHVIVQAPTRSGGIDILAPHGIVDDGSVVMLHIRIHPDQHNVPFVIGTDGYVRVQLNNNTEHRVFSHGGPYKIQNVAEGVHHLEVLLVDMHMVPIIRTGGAAAMNTTQFAFKPNKEELDRRRKIKAMEKEAVESMLTGGRMIDHNNRDEPSHGNEERREQQQLPPPPPQPQLPEPIVDVDAKRRQYALSAIGTALRAQDITKKQWARIKNMIKKDRSVANDDFRELLVDVEHYDTKDAIEFAKNLALEVEVDSVEE